MNIGFRVFHYSLFLSLKPNTFLRKSMVKHNFDKVPKIRIVFFVMKSSLKIYANARIYLLLFDI
jgi:hypothetical protein